MPYLKGEPMRILLTNDDGIHAPGLLALHNSLSSQHDLHIVAPETEMSAVGHAITLSSPLRVQEVHRQGAFYGHAVTGTPADCVKIAVQELMEGPPEVVLSGINVGANVGVNVLYSGTVSAATEGAFLGFRAAAISLDSTNEPNFNFAAEFTSELIRFIVDNELKIGTALNVNIPALPREEIKGICITRQGMSRFEERFERRSDPRGNVYYWLAGEKIVENGTVDTDYRALREKKITITPIHYDLTCDEELKRLSACAPPVW
jgi:5'-nucleotidase